MTITRRVTAAFTTVVLAVLTLTVGVGAINGHMVVRVGRWELTAATRTVQAAADSIARMWHALPTQVRSTSALAPIAAVLIVMCVALPAAVLAIRNGDRTADRRGVAASPLTVRTVTIAAVGVAAWVATVIVLIAVAG